MVRNSVMQPSIGITYDLGISLQQVVERYCIGNAHDGDKNDGNDEAVQVF